MGLLNVGVNQQTVTVATEIALAACPVNQSQIPSGTVATIQVNVSCATGTGGTTAAIKCRRGSTATGTQVGPTVTGPVGTANAATNVGYTFVDTAPPANGQYVVTLTFTGNTSSVVDSTVVVELVEGVLA